MSTDTHGERLLVTINPPVAVLTLNDPARRNPLGTATAERMVRELRALDADASVRVIVIKGAGKAFSAGGDLNEFLKSVDASASTIWESGEAWQDLFGLIPQLGKPVIAQVAGPAYAGGCGLVASCDFALCSNTATFAVPEIKIGLYALFILPWLLARIGSRHALDLSLSGRTIDATEAARIGLVNRVVPDDQLEAAVASLANTLAAPAPATMRRAKHAFNAIANADFLTGLELARGLRGAFMGSDELRAGIESFMAKKL